MLSYSFEKTILQQRPNQNICALAAYSIALQASIGTDPNDCFDSYCDQYNLNQTDISLDNLQRRIKPTWAELLINLNKNGVPTNQILFDSHFHVSISIDNTSGYQRIKELHNCSDVAYFKNARNHFHLELHDRSILDDRKSCCLYMVHINNYPDGRTFHHSVTAFLDSSNLWNVYDINSGRPPIKLNDINELGRIGHVMILKPKILLRFKFVYRSILDFIHNFRINLSRSNVIVP